MEQNFPPSSNASTSVYFASNINTTKTGFIIPGEDCRVPQRTSLPTSLVSHVKTVVKFPISLRRNSKPGGGRCAQDHSLSNKTTQTQSPGLWIPYLCPFSCSNNSKSEKPEKKKNELYLPWIQRQLASHYVLEGTGNPSAFQGMVWSINHGNRQYAFIQPIFFQRQC